MLTVVWLRKAIQDTLLAGFEVPPASRLRALLRDTSGPSSNLYRVRAPDHLAQLRIVGVGVAPGDVAADEPGLGGVVGVVGAIQAEVAQRLELGLDPVQPGGVVGGVGELDVVEPGPLRDRATAASSCRSVSGLTAPPGRISPS
jgi:hypothetical protein